MNNIVLPKNLKSEIVELISNFRFAYEKIEKLAIMQEEYKNDQNSPLFIFFGNQEENLCRVAKSMTEMMQFMVIMQEFSKDENTLLNWQNWDDDQRSNYFFQMAEKQMEKHGKSMKEKAMKL